MLLARAVSACALVLTSGCVAAFDEGRLDAARPVDASAGLDGTTRDGSAEAGLLDARAIDGGASDVSVDASLDAPAMADTDAADIDAFVSPDAFVNLDTGVDSDVPPPTDAFVSPDAAVMMGIDAFVPHDASAPIDAWSAPDAWAPPSDAAVTDARVDAGDARVDAGPPCTYTIERTVSDHGASFSLSATVLNPSMVVYLLASRAAVFPIPAEMTITSPMGAQLTTVESVNSLGVRLEMRTLANVQGTVTAQVTTSFGGVAFATMVLLRPSRSTCMFARQFSGDVTGGAAAFASMPVMRTGSTAPLFAAVFLSARDSSIRADSPAFRLVAPPEVDENNTLAVWSLVDGATPMTFETNDTIGANHVALWASF